MALECLSYDREETAERERERERETESATDRRDRERNTDKQTENDAGHVDSRQTDRWTDRQTEEQTDKQTGYLWPHGLSVTFACRSKHKVQESSWTFTCRSSANFWCLKHRTMVSETRAEFKHSECA